MKKKIFYLAVILLLGSSFVITAIAAPTIDPILENPKGGWGFKCQIRNAPTGQNWTIELDGKHILLGNLTKGKIPEDGKIRTPIFPPAFGFGKINITVNLLHPQFPFPVKSWYFTNVTMFGPLVILPHI